MTLTNSLGQPDLLDAIRMLERRLARLERGTQGSTGGDDPAVVTSLAISGLALTTQTTIGADDFYRVMMRYSWSAIPDDPSEYNKDPLDGYLTSWTIDGVHWTADLFTTDTFVDVGPFTQGQTVTFRVRGRTKKGTLGAYSTLSNTTTTDATAPFQPSTPVVLPYLGQLSIDWDGLDVSAGQPPTDFRFVEVHISTSGPTFTPTVATLVGTILRGGGIWIATDLTYGSTYYSRLVAVDTVGNRSPASTAGSAIPEKIVNVDMGANSVDTVQIVNLAVNNAKISDLSVGKLTVGSLTANMTVSARIMTASTGARVELNSSGLQAFNSGGSQTVDIAAATGAVTITGKFQTAFPGSGSPYLDMVDSGDRTTITFYDSTGSNPAFMNTPIDGGGVPSFGVNTGAFTYLSQSSKHRLFLANATGIFLETYKVSGGVAIGGRLVLGPTTAQAEVLNSSGAVLSQMLLRSSGEIQFTGFSINNYAQANSPNDWIIAGNSSIGNSISSGGVQVQAVTYGSTSPARPGVVYGLFSSTNQNHRISAFSTTGFTVTSSTNTGTFDLNYWAFRQ